MKTLTMPLKKKITVLALGAESAGNFSIYLSPPYHSLLNKERCLVVETERSNGKIFFSDDFGDLLEEKNWEKYQKEILQYLKKYKIKPQIILTDLHPLYKTTIFGKELAKKFGSKLIQVQHHHAHIFSAIGDRMINFKSYKLKAKSYCITMDGTGFGTDEKIWGGETFKVVSSPACRRGRKNKVESVERIGHLENQIMIGGDLAIKEPARMLTSILYKVFSNSSSPFGRGCRVLATGEGTGEIQHKKLIYPFIKKYYTKNEFELIYNQLQQKFNCLETSSTGRVLDAISLLLGFCGNKRNYKHEPIDLLEKNSTLPYSDLKPKIIFDNKEKRYILSSSHLFKYLLKNIKKNESLPADEAGRLASTAQLYIAKGLYGIINKIQGARNKKQNGIFISGGIANNKIISEYLISKGAYASKIIPRGDAGLSFGQIIYYLLKK